MNSFDVLHTENKVQGIWIRSCTFLRLYILNFINQNTLLLEGLSHATTPFGGSLLATRRANRKTRPTA